MTNGDVIYVSPVNNYFIGVEWGGHNTNITALPDIMTNTDALLDFSGETNTSAIVAQLGNNNGTIYAAKICADLVAYGFDDWYLPAAGELHEIYKKIGAIGNGCGEGPKNHIYWSSSEYSLNLAWYQYNYGGDQHARQKDFNFPRCRCVRK
jgi:hypothetical protein